MPAGRQAWGDDDDDDYLPPRQESAVDSKGVKNIVEYHFNANGAKVSRAWLTRWLPRRSAPEYFRRGSRYFACENCNRAAAWSTELFLLCRFELQQHCQLRTGKSCDKAYDVHGPLVETVGYNLRFSDGKMDNNAASPIPVAACLRGPKRD